MIMLSLIKMMNKSVDVIHSRTTLKNISHNTRTRLIYNQEIHYEINLWILNNDAVIPLELSYVLYSN